MAYCTNCGKDISEKTFCEECCMEIGAARNYCKWCGNSLNPNDKKCSTCGEKIKESRISKKLAYFFSAFLLLAGIATVKKSIISAVCFFIAAILLFPKTKNFIRKKTESEPNKRKTAFKIQTIGLIVFLVISVVAMPTSGNARDRLGSLFGSSDSENDEIVENVKSIAKANIYTAIAEKYGDGNQAEVTFSTVNQDGYDFELYGKVTFKDKYGDKYEGRFSATYVYSVKDKRAQMKTLNIDKISKK